MAEVEVREDGSRVRVEAGDTVVVRLRENAANGYQWSLRQVGEAMVSEHDYIVPPGLVPGSGGEHVFVFRALRPGSADVGFVYSQVWACGVKDRFSIRVDVVPSSR